MRKNICLKSMLRRPVVTLFLLLLIGSISFAFISRAVEYVVVERENERILGYYVAPGRVGGLNTNVTAAAELLETSEYVAYQDIRRYTSGILQDITNADTGISARSGWQLVGDLYPEKTGHDMILLYGTVSEIPHLLIGNVDISVEVDTVLAGYPESVSAGSTITLRYSNHDLAQGALDIGQIEVGGRYLFRAQTDWPILDKNEKCFTLSPLYIEEQLSEEADAEPIYINGPYFLAVPDGSADFDAPELALLKYDYELAYMNQHLVKITTTKNMSAMPNIAKSAGMYNLSSGRWLDYDDELAGLPVCVVHGDFARARGLEIGDKISLSFADLPASYFGYVVEPEEWLRRRIVPLDYWLLSQYVPWNAWFEDWEDDNYWSDWQSWSTAPVSEVVEFEIVGTYYKKSGYSLYGTHDRALIFIPDSCLPEGYGVRNGGKIFGGQYSFVLKSALDQNAFLAEMKEPLKKLAISAIFAESNVESFVSSMAPVRQSTAFTAAVFAAVLVLSMALAVFIYMRQRRREFAILRALGVPKGKAVMQMVLPLCLFGGLGIFGGGYISWNYSLDKASRTLAFVKMPDGIWRPMGTLSPVWLAVIAGAVMLLLIALTLAGSAVVARKPALELLQGGGGRKTKKRATPFADSADAPAQMQAEAAFIPAPLSLGAAPDKTGRPSTGAICRHVLRHIWRAPLKSALSVLVALFFVLALGWMGNAIDSNAAQIDELYASIRLEGRVRRAAGGSENIQMMKDVANRLRNTPFIEDIYLEAGVPGGFIARIGTGDGNNALNADGLVAVRAGGRYDILCAEENILLCGVSHPEAFFRSGPSTIAVEYASGWDDGMFGADWSQSGAVPVLLPAQMVEKLGLALGEDALFSDPGRAPSQSGIIVAGQYELSSDSGYYNKPLPVIMPLTALDALERGREQPPIYSAARVIASREYNSNIFKVEWEIAKILNYNLIMDTMCQFNVSEITEVMRPMEKNLRLLEVLYPVTIAISAVISCGLAVLLMLQAAREAAVMRVLGAPRLRVRTVLCSQQAALCLIGLALGLAVLAAAQSGAVARVLTGAPVLCAVLYLISSVLGSITSSIMISWRAPLELLQVKE